MDDDQIPADHVRATQVGYAVALRLLREDEHTYEDGEELIDQMGELAGSQSAHSACF